MNHVAIPTAFIKFRPTKKLHSSFGFNEKHFSKLGAFGYGATASIKSRQMRNASFKFGLKYKHLDILETFG